VNMKVGSQNYLALFERKLNSFVTLEADDRQESAQASLYVSNNFRTPAAYKC